MGCFSMPKGVEEDLLQEVQRLSVENAYQKKQALVLERARHQKKKQR